MKDLLKDFSFTATCSTCGEDYQISREQAGRIADMSYYPADELICPSCYKTEEDDLADYE